MSMRLILFAALIAGVATPAVAQRTETIDRRVERLEQELRAVQRRVFPDAGSPVLAPEIGGVAAAPVPGGVPASSPVADLNARVDALEHQLRALTGQAEQNGNRLRILEDGIAQLRQGIGARLDALERTAAATTAAVPVASPPPPTVHGRPQPASLPATQPPRAAPVSAASAAEAEAAYNAGFHLWEQKRYAEAEQALEQVARDYPGSRWASWAANLAGRAYLDAGRPATAAKTFLANYQNDPKGERAADSLYYLGQALVALKKPADACKAYDELQDVYGRTMREWLRQNLPAARAEAKCGR